MKLWKTFVDFIREDFIAYAGGISITAIVIGAIFLVMRTVSNSLITTKFNKNLEKHKSDLMKINDQYRKTLTTEIEVSKSDLMKINDKYKQELNAEMEKLRHQQQRNYKDYELYTSKRHERYPEIYKSIEISYGAISELRGSYRDLSYENVNKQDIEEYLKSEGVTSKDLNEILLLWTDDTQNLGAIIKINAIRKRIKINTAFEKWQEANNILIFNELYLTEEVSIAARSLLDLLFTHLDAIELGYLQYEDFKKEQESLKQLKDKLKKIMKSELALIPYSEVSNG